jgi:heterodisulfide reductase subunit A
MDFLKDCCSDRAPDFSGKNVVVVGGGNVAIDCARSALRLNTRRVELACLESRDEMPAHKFEVQQAIDEGVSVNCAWGPRTIQGNDRGLQCVTFACCTSVFDKEGRFNPSFDESTQKSFDADIVIMAVGLLPNTLPFARELTLNRNGTIQADKETLQTSVPAVFAGGDAVTGPSMIVQAIGQGKRAAYYIDRYLNSQSLSGFDDRLPMADRESVLGKADGKISERKQVEQKHKPVAEWLRSFEEYEITMTEEEARYSANRCLDCGGCSECRQCVAICPADAIRFDDREQKLNLTVESVLLSTGFDLYDACHKPALGYGRFPNVINAMQMDRILAPTRPYNAVVRPSDGKAPSNIAFVLCTGSRDRQADNRLCSRVCCMYSLKQAQLLMGALPLADITIYYIDIRAFGKGYDEFYEQARGMGVYFVKGKVARIEETADQNLVVHFEDIEGGKGTMQAEHDLVVLSVGMLPTQGPLGMFKDGSLKADAYNYIFEPDDDLEPGRTSIDGVFVAGTAAAARDIPDTILHADAAAMQAAAYIAGQGARG